GLDPRHATHRAADREADRRHGRIRCPAKALGGRADSGMDYPTPSLRTRLRSPPRPPRSHGPLGHDPYYEQTTHSPVRFRNGFLDLPKIKSSPAVLGRHTATSTVVGLTDLCSRAGAGWPGRI